MTKATYKNEAGEHVVAKFVDENRSSDGLLVATGVLKHGLKIGSDVHRAFTLHESLTDDLLHAERKSTTATPLNFNTEVLARQLRSLGSYDGPFTSGMLGKLKTHDFNMLREAQQEIENVGEADE